MGKARFKFRVLALPGAPHCRIQLTATLVFLDHTAGRAHTHMWILSPHPSPKMDRFREDALADPAFRLGDIWEGNSRV